MLTGQVSYRMTYNQSSYIRVRFGVYHFVRRVPADVKQHYRSDRVSISLRTKSAKAAIRSAQSISQRLDDYWHGLRLQKMDVPALHLVIDDKDDVMDDSPTMMEAVDIYLRLKSHKQTPTFIRAAKRNGKYVAEALGNRPITSYSSSDAAAFRDYLFDKGLALGSVKRIFGSVRSIINLVMLEHGIEGTNGFAKTYMPERDDIVLDADIPHVIVQPYPWRRLKTKGSARHIPLIGVSLWAGRRIQQHDSSYAFPRYCDGKICNANSASAALNKWMKPRLKDDAVVHSFRHSMRDRLRAVECPSDIIDQIGGWSASSVGASYGKGYELPVLAKWMKMLED